MKEYDILFERLVEQYTHVMRRICEHYRKKAPWDELWSAAMLGLYIADTDYRPHHGSYESYIEARINETVCARAKSQKGQVSYHSLNKRVNPSGKTTPVELIELLKAPDRDLDLCFGLWEQTTETSVYARRVAIALMGGATPEAAGKGLGLTPSQLYHVLQEIRLYIKEQLQQ